MDTIVSTLYKRNLEYRIGFVFTEWACPGGVWPIIQQGRQLGVTILPLAPGGSVICI